MKNKFFKVQAQKTKLMYNLRNESNILAFYIQRNGYFVSCMDGYNEYLDRGGRVTRCTLSMGNWLASRNPNVLNPNLPCTRFP